MKLTLSSRNMRQRKVKKCAEWLAYCLEIGWDKSQLDALEKVVDGQPR